MRLTRYFLPALVGGLLWAAPLGAQESTGSVTGRVVDSTTQQALAGVSVQVVGTPRQVVTGPDGSFRLSAVPAGLTRLRITRIGYGPVQQEVMVTGGASATLDIAMQPQASLLEAVVVTGYGTQRREAITGSVAAVDASAADVGVVSNVNNMIQGRAAGVDVVLNNGEPGSGAQIRIRGGTSINASNEPLYVIDGVPIYNFPAEANGIGIGGDPPLPRSPLNLLNSSDIGSITILKDAASAAIYGSRAANGVVLIETKKGGSGGATMEYDGYVAMASPARYLELLTGSEYRSFVQAQVAAGNLPASRLTGLGPADTDWEREVTRSAVTHNHNLSFAGGSDLTRYRASLNFMNQEGVTLSSGFERVQGRLSGTHRAFDERLRLGLNVTASHIDNDYLAYETGGGFEGGVFQNVAVFNPTQPVTVTDATGKTVYYEIGTGRQSVRNPVALAEQIQDFGNTTRVLGNTSAEVDLFEGVTAQVNVGVDRSEGTRRIYLPRSSPAGAEWNGRARVENRDNTSVTFQSYVTLRRQIAAIHDFDVVGGYEFNEFTGKSFGAEARNFLTDAFSFDNLGAGNALVKPFSGRGTERLVSFFARANYGFRNRYFLTGVLRNDGSSKFGSGHKWALFPAISGSWRISEEGFMQNAPLSLSSLSLRAGWGLQGNQDGIPPYSSLALLEPNTRYPFGDAPVTGVSPTRNPNPDLKWEETEQINVALDYGFVNNRVSGTVEYYVKNTSDLLLDVVVAQPASVSSRIENIGKIRNKGLEIAVDAVALNRPNLMWRAGIVFARVKNEVVDLGGRSFITTGGVSGQGQSGQVSQRIMPGHPLGTFFGPAFVGVNPAGQQLFACSPLGIPSDTLCINGQILGTRLRAGDSRVIGDANPDFTLGFQSQVNWGKLDASFLVRAEVGRDVFNNTALVYGTKGNVLQDKNFLASALNDPTGIGEPSIYSSRWIESGSFLRLQNITVGYTLDNLPWLRGSARSARIYVSGDNLVLVTGYSGYDPEVHAGFQGLASRGIDYLSYPRPRTFTAGVRFTF